MVLKISSVSLITSSPKTRRLQVLPEISKINPMWIDKTLVFIIDFMQHLSDVGSVVSCWRFFSLLSFQVLCHLNLIETVLFLFSTFEDLQNFCTYCTLQVIYEKKINPVRSAKIFANESLNKILWDRTSLEIYLRSVRDNRFVEVGFL